jgi:uncharacterized protein (TIGR02145 family)
MAENLNIGMMITGTTEMANNSIIEKYCYENNTANCETYGALYQWNEVMQYTIQPEMQGMCPAGWHIPTDTEWCTVTQFIDPTVICPGTNGQKSGNDVGIKMKSTSWSNQVNANASGFTAIPSGSRDYGGGGSYGLLDWTVFWSSTELDYRSWCRQLSTGSDGVYRNANIKTASFSVRCLKNN